MADDHDLPIGGTPDSSGLVFPEPAEAAMALGTATYGTLEVTTIQAPSGADVGIYGKFKIPQEYVGTPRIVITGALGEAANTLAFGFQQVAVADIESIDQAFEAEDTVSNAVWTGYAAEDLIELVITLTPAAAYQPGDQVFFFFYRDDSVDTQTGEFHLTDLAFRFADA